jgi:hypothetical protein
VPLGLVTRFCERVEDFTSPAGDISIYPSSNSRPGLGWCPMVTVRELDTNPPGQRSVDPTLAPVRAQYAHGVADLDVRRRQERVVSRPSPSFSIGPGGQIDHALLLFHPVEKRRCAFCRISVPGFDSLLV